MIPTRPHPRRAFTLIEVVLAIGLATALLLVALTFYHQSSQLRSQILRSSQDLAAARLTLDQLANDLRSAVPVPAVSFIGGPDSVEFARIAPPLSKPRGTNASGAYPTLQRVSFHAVHGQESTNSTVRGLDRTETALFQSEIQPNPNLSSSTNTPFPSLPTPPAFPATDATNNAPNPNPKRLLTESVRYLNFRYYNGSAWQESWFATAPPTGIEITIGLDPLPDDAAPETEPSDRFRRVVWIPSGRRSDPATSSTNSFEDIDATFPPNP